jgi:Leucine-rich repeat (LRR) protein
MSAPIQGLRVSLKLADAQDPIEILTNINLDIQDLNRIRGIASEGVETSDIRSLSGLSVDLEKQVVAINNEVNTYSNILASLNDGRNRIEGNLDISGNIVASRFKFRTLDDTNQVQTVDLSTSRTSSWSFFDDPATSVFYGGDVVLSGANSTIEVSSLEFQGNPIQKRFESQIPTHKIRINIDGDDYDLYAMKGIPIQFRGFFRSVRDLRVDFNIIDSIRPSWIIRNRIDRREFVFQNRISGTGPVRQSIISLFDSTSRDREIEFYYPVDRIVRIDMNSARITEVPSVTIPNLSSLSIVNGDLLEMPDVSVLYPNLTSLNLSNNNLTRSRTSALRTFSPAVVNRLKTPTNTLRILILDRVYSNACTADLSELTSLVTFRADSSPTNSRRMTGQAPAIGPSVLSYNINGNNFSSLHPSIVQSSTLQSLTISGNFISGTIDTSGTNLQNIQTFVSGGNSHAIVDMSGKASLRTYSNPSQTFSGAAIGTNIFAGCGFLEEVTLSSTNVTGNLPNFTSNTRLRRFISNATRWQDATANNSIAENTFGPSTGGCRATLTNFDLQSPNLSQPIHPLAFANMTALSSLTVSSLGNGITGPFPESIADCFNLTDLRLNNNQMTGEIPNFASNRRLVTLILSQNNFSGILPALSLPSLRTLSINGNDINLIQSLDCPNLISLNAASNSLQEIPSFRFAFRIQQIILSNNSGMRYNAGELQTVTALRRVEMANCGLNQGEIDTILIDLNENYDRRPRRGVVVNLVGNAAPSATTEIQAIINRLRREGWTIGLGT